MAENTRKTPEISKAVYTGGKGVITRAYSDRFAHSNRMDGTGRHVMDSIMSRDTTSYVLQVTPEVEPWIAPIKRSS